MNGLVKQTMRAEKFIRERADARRAVSAGLSCPHPLPTPVLSNAYLQAQQTNGLWREAEPIHKKRWLQARDLSFFEAVSEHAAILLPNHQTSQVEK